MIFKISIILIIITFPLYVMTYQISMIIMNIMIFMIIMITMIIMISVII